MILDVGCGNNPKGDVNIDINMKKGVINFIRADAHHLPFKDNCFNRVFCYHCLEHLHNPLAVLREISRVKQNNGYVEIYTPSIYEVSCGCEHIYGWNDRHLHNLLSLVFSNVHVRYTARVMIIQGRMGKYLSFLNLVLAKMGIRKELHALAW